MSIRYYADRDTEDFATGKRTPPEFVRFANVARRKLERLDAATRIEDLASPPGNKLEKLKYARAGQWGLRINDQYRICFYWTDSGPEGVEITDYHDEPRKGKRR